MLEVPGDSHLSRIYPMKLGKMQQHGYFTQPFGLQEHPLRTWSKEVGGE